MPTRSERFRRDVTACRAILRAGSRTFHSASWLLPARVRAPASVLYAFCRVADDAVDGQEGGPSGHSPRTDPRAVDRLHTRLLRAYAGRPLDGPIDRALADVVAIWEIPRTVPEALLEGLAWDTTGRKYADLPGLRSYAVRVASAVGVMMTVLMGERDGRVLARACDLGAAMQLTNIARDVGEDARNGRLYLPLGWMLEAGMDPEVFLACPVPSPALASVVERLLAEADRLYARADAGVRMLPRDCRAAIRGARLVYAAIGDEVRRAGCDPVTRRATVPGWRRLWLLARAAGAWWSPTVKAGGDEAPALPEARGLIRAVDPTYAEAT